MATLLPANLHSPFQRLLHGPPQDTRKFPCCLILWTATQIGIHSTFSLCGTGKTGQQNVMTATHSAGEHNNHVMRLLASGWSTFMHLQSAILASRQGIAHQHQIASRQGVAHQQQMPAGNVTFWPQQVILLTLGWMLELGMISRPCTPGVYRDVQPVTSQALSVVRGVRGE